MAVMMMSSQGIPIGLITVIAVSGCGVVLLMLGRQKLVELRKDYSKPEQEQEEEQEAGLGSLSRSTCDHSFNTYSLSWRINLDILGASGGSQDCSKKTPKSATEASSQDKKRNVVKKVRFCEDVVEPSGNSAEYRRRQRQRQRQRYALPSRSGGQNTHNNSVCSRKKTKPSE